MPTRRRWAASGLRGARRRTLGTRAATSWTLMTGPPAPAAGRGGRGRRQAAGRRPSSVVDGPPLVCGQGVVRLLHALERVGGGDVAAQRRVKLLHPGGDDVALDDVVD